jgi:sporulation protein YlmC with PRC-barrel domain
VQVAAATVDAGLSTDQASLQRIVGKALYGADGVKIGTVGDVVVGREGRVVAALVSVGGFFGFGGREVSVPLDRIRVGEGDRLTTTLPRDALDPPR